MSNKTTNAPRMGAFRGGPFGGAPEKAKDFKKTVKKIFHYIKPYYTTLIVAVVFTIISTFFGILTPKILGDATTEIFKGYIEKLTNKGGIDFNWLVQTLQYLFMLYILSGVFMISTNWILTKVAQNISYDLRKQISKKINKLPLKYFDTKTHGEILSRITNDVDTISNSLQQTISQLLTAVITITGVLIMMYSINWIMATVILFVVPLSGMITFIIISKTQKYYKDLQEYLGKTNGYVEEMYTGHIVLKAFNRQRIAVEGFDKINSKLRNSAQKAQFFSGIIMPLLGFVGNIGYIVVVFLGGILASNGTITVGSILSFAQYVNQFNWPISQAAQIANVMQAMVAASERVFEFLEEKEEQQQSSVLLSSVNGEVEFINIHFGYDSNKIVINDFNAKIKPGMRVAIVGPTGSGKTTLVKLLMRFYDLNSGEILIDGINIKDIERSELRSYFGMVLQDAWLFGGTIMENIRYGNLKASKKDVYEAAKAAHVDRFIRTLPDGYDTELNEETTNISQGQKQLLTIARTILSNPKMLILDEATSSIDTRTEVLIQTAMGNLMKNKTSFIIAHRLSTIKDADLILVLKNGDIIEQGTHEQLILAKGYYNELYKSQFETV